MWSGCHPKSDDELAECEELGKSLNRMSQPTILAILAEAGSPLHGYKIVKLCAGSPMFGGRKPDAAGIYRTLKRMEEQGLVTAAWETPESGAAKRQFDLTEKGRAGLRRWIDALACYCLTIQDLRQMASDALGIELPDAPFCHHDEPETSEALPEGSEGYQYEAQPEEWQYGEYQYGEQPEVQEAQPEAQPEETEGQAEPQQVEPQADDPEGQPQPDPDEQPEGASEE